MSEFTVVNPATEQTVSTVTLTSADEADAAIESYLSNSSFNGTTQSGRFSYEPLW